MMRRALGLAAALWLLAPRAYALDLGSEGSLASVEVHAFASQGFIFTTNNNYLDADTTHGSFQFSEVGINFTKSITDKLRMGVQLFAQDLGPTGNFNAKMDWFYLDYRYSDWLGLRFGRVKVPFGLYNEVNDVDSARIPVLLPQSVYPLQNRNYLLAQTGAELYGYARMGRSGALDYRAYAGTIFLDTSSVNFGPIQIANLDVPYLVGGRVLWETPVDGLRAGASLQVLRIDTQLVTQMQTVHYNIPATLWVGSLEYSARDWLLATEYSRWYLRADSSNNAILPGSPVITSERAYAMVGYRVRKWLQPGLYYSVLFPDVDHRDGRDGRQFDFSATARFDIGEYWLVKLEAHWMQGTAGLTPALNNGTPLSELDRYWSVFLVKTTGYF